MQQMYRELCFIDLCATILQRRTCLGQLARSQNKPFQPYYSALIHQRKYGDSIKPLNAMSSPSSNGSQPSPASAIDFLLLLQQLKLTKRTGWVRKNVDGPESIADHMYRMSVMALIATDSKVDVNRCIKMALVHDMAESLVGDVTPHCGVSDEDKHARELAAVERMAEMLGTHTDAAREVQSLWHEYEAASSPEAQLVKDFDKLEMIITAHQYEETHPGLALEEFFTSTAGRFKTDTGKAWAAELISRRARRMQPTEGTQAIGAGAAEEARD